MNMKKRLGLACMALAFFTAWTSMAADWNRAGGDIGWGTVGKISVTGNLTLNANAITINVTGSALAAGTYRLLDCTGTLANTGTFGKPTPSCRLKELGKNGTCILQPLNPYAERI